MYISCDFKNIDAQSIDAMAQNGRESMTILLDNHNVIPVIHTSH